MKKIKTIISFTVFCVFTFLAFGSFEDDKPVNQKPEIEIYAKQLTEDYDDNEISADKKYKNKIIKVTGYVGEISKVLGESNVEIFGYRSMRIQCSFAEEFEEELSKLEKGEEITIIGKCQGLSLIDVQMKNCRLEKSKQPSEEEVVMPIPESE